MPINLSTLLLARVTNNRQDVRLILVPQIFPNEEGKLLWSGQPFLYHKFWLIKHLPQRSAQRTATNDQERHKSPWRWNDACSLPPNLRCSLEPSASPESNDVPRTLWPWLDQGQRETQGQWWFCIFYIEGAGEAASLGKMGAWICICRTLNTRWENLKLKRGKCQWNLCRR